MIPLQPPSERGAERLRDFFCRSDYTEDGVQELFGFRGSPIPSESMLGVLRERTAEPSPLAFAARWWVLGDAIPLAEWQEQIDADDVRLLVDAGLLRREGSALVSDVMLVPIADLWIASDAYRRLRSVDAADFVLCAGPTARYLLDFIIRRPVARVLDLCCGAGVHGLVAARHASSVSASDLNPRAAEFVRFNAALNGCERVRALAGDRWAPVENERFDLIVCNPPFVLSPSPDYLYRDNPLPLDQFCRELIAGAPDHLSPGGFFQMIFEWVEVAGERWTDRVGGWLRELGCDALVLKVFSQTPTEYAQNRVREMHGATGQRATEADEAAWCDYFRRHQVESIHGGLIALRRGDGDHWLRFAEMPGLGDRPIEDQVLAVFLAEDLIRSCPRDEQLAQRRPRLTSDARLLQRRQLSGQEWQIEETLVQVDCRWESPLSCDERFAEFLPRFDGEPTVGELHRQFAERLGADTASTAGEFCQSVRNLLRRGILRAEGA